MPVDGSGMIVSIMLKKCWCDSHRCKNILWHNPFHLLPFFGPHTKPYGLWVLSKHYNILLEPKLGHESFEIRRTPCACVAYITMLYNTWGPGVSHTQEPLYQIVVKFTYWPVLCTFNNCNINNFTNETTSSEDFDDIHKKFPWWHQLQYGLTGEYR